MIEYIYKVQIDGDELLVKALTMGQAIDMVESKDYQVTGIYLVGQLFND